LSNESAADGQTCANSDALGDPVPMVLWLRRTGFTGSFSEEQADEEPDIIHVLDRSGPASRAADGSSPTKGALAK